MTHLLHRLRCWVFVGCWLAAMTTHAQRTLIYAGALIDGVAETPRSNVTVIIEKGKIAALEAGFTNAKPGDNVIDLKKKFVLPGLMDMHTHLSGQTEKAGYLKRFQMYPPDAALAATPFLKATLLSGFTTVRDLGAGDFVDFALRNAVQRGDGLLRKVIKPACSSRSARMPACFVTAAMRWSFNTWSKPACRPWPRSKRQRITPRSCSASSNNSARSKPASLRT